MHKDSLIYRRLGIPLIQSGENRFNSFSGAAILGPLRRGSACGADSMIASTCNEQKTSALSLDQHSRADLRQTWLYWADYLLELQKLH
jgi:hypothetical protein